MRNELESHFDEFKGVYEVLPSNNKENRKKKSNYLQEEIDRNNTLVQNVKDEIETRLKKFNSLKENSKIKTVFDKLEKCNISNEWNEYNTAYEKMHLDFYLYQLEKYSKEDLVSVNDCLRKLIESFNKVGITLKMEDFDFSNQGATYMNHLIIGDKDEELKTIFEELYWSFPELIKTIEINFKSIYQRYEKKIDKYYKDRNEEFLKNVDNKDIINLRIELNKEYKQLVHRDAYTIFNRFKNNEYQIGALTDAAIKGKVSTYFENGSYDYDTLVKLTEILFEDNLIIKYRYLLDDLAARLEKKDEFKNSRANAIKGILADEKKLKGLNKAHNKKGLFGKSKKNDEKWLFKYKETLTSLTEKYDALDNECFNNLIFDKLSSDSTIFEAFKLITSNYLFYVTKIRELDEFKSLSDITKDFNELKEDINNKVFTILNNVVLLEKRDIKEIISDKYKLEGINLPIELLEEDSVEKVLMDINDLIRFEDIKKSGLDLADIELYLEYEKMNKEK